MEPVTSPHPLFNSESRYNYFRSGFAPEDKIHGYFKELARRLRHGDPVDMEAGQTSISLVLLADAPEQVVPALGYAELDPPSASSEGTLPSEGTLRVRLQLTDLASRTVHLPASFRAFLLEPEVLDPLSRAIEAVGQSQEFVLRRVFAREVVADNLQVARILSGVPELEGTINTNGSGETSHLSVPSTQPSIGQLPDRVTVVVVIDHPREPAV
jgi:hypothetical protein